MLVCDQIETLQGEQGVFKFTPQTPKQLLRKKVGQPSACTNRAALRCCQSGSLASTWPAERRWLAALLRWSAFAIDTFVGMDHPVT
jgi:hypothetical protein